METSLPSCVNKQLHASRVPWNPWELTQDQIDPEGHFGAGVSWKLGPHSEGLLQGRREGTTSLWRPLVEPLYQTEIRYLGRGYKTKGEQSVLFKY